MEFSSPPRRKERVYVPEGLDAKMCLCGIPSRLMKSTDLDYTYGRRYWMCANSSLSTSHEYSPLPHSPHEFTFRQL
uniref:Zinc finger GRF-type domain-containing protein n=1 Tax=Arundo donax TaxID=35708 RepID=A0A0A9CI21_ARUDO